MSYCIAPKPIQARGSRTVAVMNRAPPCYLDTSGHIVARHVVAFNWNKLFVHILWIYDTIYRRLSYLNGFANEYTAYVDASNLLFFA